MLMAIGQESDLPRSFDGPRQLMLVFSTITGLPPALDLALIGDIALKDAHILVVHLFHPVNTESTDAAAGVITALLPLPFLLTLAFLARCLSRFVLSDDLLCQLYSLHWYS